MYSRPFVVKEVAQLRRVSVGTVLGWIASGELRAINVARKLGSKKPRWRITEEALTEFEATRTAIPPAPKARRRRRDPAVVEFYK